MKRPYRHTALLTLWLLMMCSCSHKELEYPNSDGTTRIVFDWSQAPDAQPDGMLLVSFRGTAQPVKVAFADPNGGDLHLSAAEERQFIAHNDNTEDLGTQGLSWETYEIYALPTTMATFSPMFAASRSIPMAPGTEYQRVIFEPNELWTSALPNVSLGSGSVTMQMESATRRFNFIIEGVENLENVVELAATISGMSSSYFPATRTFSTPECIIPFSIAPSGQSTIQGSVRIFGHAGEADASVTDDPQVGAEHHLVVYLMLNDYSKYYTAFDVTDAVNEAISSGEDDDGTPFNVVIPEFTIPEPLTNGTGLHPAVDTWQEIDIDIKM